MQKEFWTRPRTWAAAAAIALLGVGFQEDLASRIERQIQRLQNDSIEEREDAARQLNGFGPEAIPFLEKASRDQEREVRTRIEEVLHRLRRRAVAESL